MRHPRILLLDEPLGALDALTKMNMQVEIINIELPRPRLRSSDDFAFYRNKIINIFNQSIVEYAI